MGFVLSGVVVGGVYALGILVLLLRPGDTPVPDLVWILAFVGAFPAFGAGVISRRVTTGQRASTLTSSWPRTAVLRCMAVYVVAALTVLVLSLTRQAVPAGQPVRTADGRYALDSHGDLTYVTRAEYEHALVGGQSFFVGGALVFYLAGAYLVTYSVTWSSPRQTT
jgi:hypothetical protein